MLEDAISNLIETGAIFSVANAIREGKLNKDSHAAALDTILPGQTRAQQAAAFLLKSWSLEIPNASAHTVARLLECAANLNARGRPHHGAPRLVWTGPEASGFYPRSSRQIAREIIIGARKELWLTAFWIAGPRDGEGIVGDIVDLLADATERGLDVALALDGRPRLNGETNFDVLRALWPRGFRRPRLYTWSQALHEPHLKLHAKVLVADRTDALVTSANLTMHALERNMELGVRLQGVLANEISLQLDRLVSTNILTVVAI